MDGHTEVAATAIEDIFISLANSGETSDSGNSDSEQHMTVVSRKVERMIPAASGRIPP